MDLKGQNMRLNKKLGDFHEHPVTLHFGQPSMAFAIHYMLEACEWLLFLARVALYSLDGDGLSELWGSKQTRVQ